MAKLKVGKANLDHHAETERELQKGDRRYWSPVEGRNQVRIMPPSEGHEEIFSRAGFHYGIGADDRMFPCPKIGGERERCFLCTTSDRLSKSKDEDNVAEAKELRATKRFLITVVDLQKPKDGFKVWPVGIKLFREILYYFSDPDYGDVSDLEEGYDFTVIRKGSGLNTEYSIRCAKKPTNFLEDFGEFFGEESFDDLPILEGFLEYATDTEMEATYNGTSTGTRSQKIKDEEDEGEGEEDAPRTRRGRGSPDFPDEGEEGDKAKSRKTDDDGEGEEDAPRGRSGRASGRTGSRLRRGLRS